MNRKHAHLGSTNREFGFVWGSFLLIVAVLPLYHGKEVRRWALFAGAAFYILSWLFPKILSPLNRLWTQFGALIARVTNPIVMAAVFYGIFTPVAVLLRLQKKDPLRLRWDAAAETYWIPRTPPGPSPDSMSEQF